MLNSGPELLFELKLKRKSGPVKSPPKFSNGHFNRPEGGHNPALNSKSPNYRSRRPLKWVPDGFFWMDGFWAWLRPASGGSLQTQDGGTSHSAVQTSKRSLLGRTYGARSRCSRCLVSPRRVAHPGALSRDFPPPGGVLEIGAPVADHT